MSGVEIRVRANAKQAQNEIRKTGKSLKSLETQAADITKTFRRMAIGLTAVFAGGGITRGINSAADAMIGLNNRVKLVTKDAKTTQKTINDLFDIAARSGGSIDAAAETFNRFGLALRDSGKSVNELLTVTEAVQKAAIISGSGAESAKAAIVQLGQGLASGQLRGQELNSVLEQMPRLAQAIAEGMKIPFGKLREEAMAGKITAEAVFQALLDGAGKINDEFGTLQFTTADLATVMKNELTRAISEFDRVTGFSEAFKAGILGLTTAFRFVGKNIERWSLNTQLAFLIVESQAKDFVKGITDLFSADFDAAAFGKRLGESLTKAFKDAKSFGAQKVEIALDFSVKKYNLIKSMFPEGEGGILSTLTRFATKVKDIFVGLWKAIVGDSWWTGIFDPSHEELGKASIGNVQSWGKHLDKARNYIAGWAVGIAGVFEELHFEALDAWQLLVTDVETQGFTTTASQRIVNPLKEAFNSLFDEIGNAYNRFALSGLGTQIKLPTTNEITDSWNETLTSMREAYDKTIGVINELPIVVAAKVAFDTASENFSEITDGVKGFFKDNEANLTTVIASGMAIAFSKGLRSATFKLAIPLAILSAVGGLGNSPEFLAAVGKTAKSFGETFKDLISGDGDVVANILTGLGNVFSTIGTSFIDGLFGEDFESDFVDSGATALSAALVALAVAPTLTKAAAMFGIKLGGMLLAPSAFSTAISGVATSAAFIAATTKLRTSMFALLFAADMASPKIVSGLSTAMTGAGKAKKFLSAAKALGKRLIAGIAIGFTANAIGDMLGDALGLNKVNISYDEFGDGIKTSSIGTTLFDLFNDALSGAIAGFVVGGPWGAVAGALGGALLGIFVSEEQKNGIINMFHVVKDAVLDGLTSAWDAFKEYASDWTPNWLKDLFGAKEGFGGSQEFEADASQLPASFAGYGQQPGETDEEYRKRAQNFNTGGYVSGAGTGTSDSIPAMLSNGEYVIKAAAVNKLGKGKLDLLNQGILPKFATGGIVGRAQTEIRDSFARGDVGLAMEMISLVEQLGKLDETLDGLTDEMKKEVKKVANVGGRSEEEQTQIDNLRASFNSQLSSAISAVMHGGDWKDVLHGLLDSVTSTIINNFADGLAEGITKNIDFDSMFDGLGNIFSSGFSMGGGSGIGGLLSAGLGFLGFSQGGVVPNIPGSQAGKDSVPAMLMPGEVVLSKNDVRNMNNNQSGTQQSFNINVSGDVSRQTRKEIVKMLPQITSGVNMNNKESNYRR